MKKHFLLLCLLISAVANGQTLTTLNWNTYTVIDPQMSAGFIDVSDFNNDGIKEITLSTLMEVGSASSPWQAKGAIRKFSLNTSTVSSNWTPTVILPTSENLPFCNTPQIFDIDGDGNKDVLLQQGFLQTNGGSHQWLKGPAFTQRFNFAPETTHGNTYFFWHESEQVDLDGDGLMDIVTTSAQTQDASNTNNSTLTNKNAKIEWYRNLGGGNFQYYLINDSLGGVFIKVHDIDHDGDKDIVVSQFFWDTNRPALVWLENTSNPSVGNSFIGNWNYHTIDNTTGLGYHFEFYDIDADGDEDLVYGNHNNQDNTSITDGNGNVIMPGIFWFEIPANPASSSQWTKHTIYDGFRTNLFDFFNPASQGCPGIFSIGDVDLNGKPDIVVPGDGNDTLYLFRQQLNGTWQKEVLDNGKMFGMAKITDIDNDGIPEIVAAKHNFPESWEILFPPAGFLKIYQPQIPNLSINENEEGNLFLYPNPSRENTILSIYTNQEEMVNIILSDMTGKVLFSEAKKITNGTNELLLNYNTIPSGCYLISVRSTKGSRTLKWIKE